MDIQKGRDAVHELAPRLPFVRGLPQARLKERLGRALKDDGQLAVVPCPCVDRRADVAEGRVRVQFVLSSAGWDGRDDRRPEWLQVMNDNTPLWPEREIPAGDWRLNLDPLRGYLFGRLRGWRAR